MRKPGLGLVFALSLSLCSIHAAWSDEPANLLSNPSFEDGGSPPSGWHFQEDPLPEITVGMDTDFAHSGSRSCRVSNTRLEGWEEAGIYASQVAIPSSLLFYDFSFWTRLQDAKRVRSALYWRDKDGDIVGTSNDVIVEYDSDLPMTHDWELQSATHIAAPTQAVTVDVYLYGQGPGEFWFDDVEFKFHRPDPFPVFPDLVPDSVLDRDDAISLSRYFSPGERGYTEFGTGDLPGFIRDFADRGPLTPGLSFRDFFPLHDGDDYYYRSNDYPNNIDWFRRRTTGPLTIHDRRAYRLQVYDTPPEDTEGRQSAIVSATGPFEFLQFIIDTEIFDEHTGLIVPTQTIDLNPGLVLALANVQVGDTDTSTAQGTVDVEYEGTLVEDIPATLTLESVAMDVGQTVILQDDGSTAVTDTLVLASQVELSGTIPLPPVPFTMYFEPGSAIMWFVRGVGMVQMQEFTDKHTEGEVFPLRSATVGGAEYP